MVEVAAAVVLAEALRAGLAQQIKVEQEETVQMAVRLEGVAVHREWAAMGLLQAAEMVVLEFLLQ